MIRPEDIADSRQRRLLEHWQRLRGARAVPARRELDPLDIPYALGELFLIDVEGDPPVFRYRLTASKLVEFTGYDLVGRTVDDVPGDANRAQLLAAYRRIVAAREPVLIEGAREAKGQWWSYALLGLPLSDDGARVDSLAIHQVYDRRKPVEPPKSR